MMYDWICHNGFDPIIIATKLDKIKRSQVPKQIKLIRDTLQGKAGDHGAALLRPDQAGPG